MGNGVKFRLTLASYVRHTHPHIQSFVARFYVHWHSWYLSAKTHTAHTYALGLFSHHRWFNSFKYIGFSNLGVQFLFSLCVLHNIRQCLQWMHVISALFQFLIMLRPVSKYKHTHPVGKRLTPVGKKKTHTPTQHSTHQFRQIQMKLNSLRCDRIAKRHSAAFFPPCMCEPINFLFILYRWLR